MASAGPPGPAEGSGPSGPEESAAPSGSRWFTGRGDDGTTGLLGPGRVPKHDARPEAFGAVDEAQAAIGLARAAGCAPEVRPLLLQVQRDLSTLMAELAAAGADDSPFSGQVTADHVAQLEEWLAEVDATVAPRDFVLPGDTLPGAALHLARTVVRRAERESVRLAHGGLLPNPHVVRYLNRLSSLLFLLACAEDARAVSSSGHGRP